MSNPITDPVLGQIDVYREYKSKNDEIEYTTFFRVGDKKYRNDTVLQPRDFEEILDSGAEVVFVRNKIYDSIRNGEFVSASDFETPLDDEEKSAVLNELAKKQLESIGKMREVPRDDKWKDEREANDARRDAYSSTADADVSATSEGFEAGVLMNTGPTETELVTVALLMRLYDVNMALLSHFDKATADNIFDTHAEGGTFNPQIFIPALGEDDEDTIGG